MFLNFVHRPLKRENLQQVTAEAVMARGIKPAVVLGAVLLLFGVLSSSEVLSEAQHSETTMGASAVDTAAVALSPKLVQTIGLLVGEEVRRACGARGGRELGEALQGHTSQEAKLLRPAIRAAVHRLVPTRAKENASLGEAAKENASLGEAASEALSPKLVRIIGGLVGEEVRRACGGHKAVKAEADAKPSTTQNKKVTPPPKNKNVAEAAKAEVKAEKKAKAKAKVAATKKREADVAKAKLVRDKKAKANASKLAADEKAVKSAVAQKAAADKTARVAKAAADKASADKRAAEKKQAAMKLKTESTAKAADDKAKPAATKVLGFAGSADVSQGCPPGFQDTTPAGKASFARKSGCPGRKVEIKVRECTCGTCTAGKTECLPTCKVKGLKGEHGLLSSFAATLSGLDANGAELQNCPTAAAVVERVYMDEYLPSRESSGLKFERGLAKLKTKKAGGKEELLGESCIQSPEECAKAASSKANKAGQAFRSNHKKKRRLRRQTKRARHANGSVHKKKRRLRRQTKRARHANGSVHKFTVARAKARAPRRRRPKATKFETNRSARRRRALQFKEASWATPSDHVDVLADGLDGKWGKRLLVDLEGQVNEVPLPGLMVGCQATLGMANYYGSRLKMNCCGAGNGDATSCRGDSKSIFGGAPVSMDDEAIDKTKGKWKAGGVKMLKEAGGGQIKAVPALCEWPRGGSDGMPTRPSDKSIHMFRIAACGAEHEPLCAMIKITKNKNKVVGFGMTVPTDRQAAQQVLRWQFQGGGGGGASIQEAYEGGVDQIAQRSIEAFVSRADFVVRKAVASLRFAVAQVEIFKQPLKSVCLPKPCPTVEARKKANAKPCMTSLNNFGVGFCASTCQRPSKFDSADSLDSKDTSCGVPKPAKCVAEKAQRKNFKELSESSPRKCNAEYFSFFQEKVRGGTDKERRYICYNTLETGARRYDKSQKLATQMC